MALSIFLAWIVGFWLYFLTVVAAGYDGITTVFNALFGGGLVSAVHVTVCVVVGFLLRLRPLGRAWRSSLAISFGFLLVGAALFAFSFAPGQFRDAGEEDGSTVREFGVTWLPGYLLVLFAIVHFPLALRPSRPANDTA